MMAAGTMLESWTCQNWGLTAAAMAATSSVRGYFVTHSHRIRDAFEVGRDVASMEPTPLRHR